MPKKQKQMENQQQFTAYLQSRDLAKTTQYTYARSVEDFLNWYGGDTTGCTKKDVLNYLKHKDHYSRASKSQVLNALKHYFAFLRLDGNPTALLKIRGNRKKTLYYIYTPEQLTQLYDDYRHVYIQSFKGNTSPYIPDITRLYSDLGRQRNHSMLGFLVYQGITTASLHKIKLDDIDLSKAQVHITGNRNSNARNIDLQACQIGALMSYLQNTRPQIVECGASDTDRLFLSLPVGNRGATDLRGCAYAFAKQVKKLDKDFKNFKQVRASVITNWIKTKGLRKAQYLAGHRYISSTERYLGGDLENLTDDITRFNPF